MNVCIYPMAECHFLSLGYLPNFTNLPKKIEIFTGKKYFTKPITELTPNCELFWYLPHLLRGVRVTHEPLQIGDTGLRPQRVGAAAQQRESHRLGRVDAAVVLARVGVYYSARDGRGRRNAACA